MPAKDHKTFEIDEFILQINADHLLYAEKSEVVFDFRKIAKIRIHRRKGCGKVFKITYRVKGQLTTSQIDGFADSDMQSIAALFKARAGHFSIPITDV